MLTLYSLKANLKRSIVRFWCYLQSTKGDEMIEKEEDWSDYFIYLEKGKKKTWLRILHKQYSLLKI